MNLLRSTRRPFVAGLVAGLLVLAGCAGPGLPRPTSTSVSGPEPDVIVVGAGLSGLTTAKELIRTGHNVLVLEATNRIGGRANTDESFTVPIDLGAAWLHGVKTNPLVRVAGQLRLERVPTNLNGPVFIGKHRLTEPERQDLDDAYAATEKKMTDDSAKGLDRSASESLLTQPELRALVAANIGPLESGAEIEKTSSADSAAFATDPDDFVRQGIGTLVARFGHDVPVQLNSPVTAIRYAAAADGGVIVEVDRGRVYRARRVVVTVSTGVLAARRIAFQPELPDWKWEAIRGLPMGLLNKVVLQFDREVLAEEGNSAWVLYQRPTPPGAPAEVMAFVVKPLGANIVVGFYGADQARRFETAGDAAAIAYAKSALTDMYGADVVARIRDSATKVTHWATNSWTLGSYSAALPGASKQHAELAKPVADRVFFAGEAAGPPEFNGSLAAAYVAGLQAARAVRASLENDRPLPHVSRLAPHDQTSARTALSHVP